MNNIPGTERPPLVDMIRNSIRQPEKKISKKQEKLLGQLMAIPVDALAQDDRLIRIKPANQWVYEEKKTQAPKMLFGDFWREGELCLLFADTNMGKSVLAVQIADSISRGHAIEPFAMQADASTVLYIDFELTGKQFQLRCTDDSGTYQFSHRLFRAEYNTQREKPDHYETLEAYMQDTLAWAIRNTQPQVIIIDNITCLNEGTQQAGQAIMLMKYLKKLQVKNKLSILVLAHTPKRNTYKPITRDDMGGSKMLMNFADSAFTIAPSYSVAGYRYLKQVKQRSGHEVYGEKNICLVEFARECGLLCYNFKGYAHEFDHLRRYYQLMDSRVKERALEMHSLGVSQRRIAMVLDISVGKVNKLVKEFKNDTLNHIKVEIISPMETDHAL